MKPFHFKQFSIQQSKKVFRVGTDGVLLGAASTVNNAKNILEVGTGTGLISLMLAQRNLQAEIHAIDINENAVALAAENFENSPFQNRVKVFLQDYKKFNSKEKYDLIVSNPPYFEENASQKDITARQQTELSFGFLVEKSSDLLSEKGLLSVIIPFDSGVLFEEYCSQKSLYLNKRIQIYGIRDAKPKRLILEFGLQKKEANHSDFVIEKSPRKYTDEYLKLTEEFHQFSK
ncbi:tRNA1(Val) (adenine(37)-N6)-methyltransferase [Chryseobacterium salivictor]|uniref:tRNA1(Val) (adenine(37)-N6)-methyltransferase n=1 Tax=Chryseobacterium salivictor TaxID=2547600 RepID=A0A4P6ZF58_9FLAO|nr:methyltransferase [Chryseobacterium salivictor]QBO58167.1 tRNA1(Val) (adenine(37)-N6)-methyltransferase [Chryseobacterium salivictor]